MLAWLLVVCWMLFIYSMSADSGAESSSKSGRVVGFVAELIVPDYEDMSESEQAEVRARLSYPIRKLAHFTEYAILGILLYSAVILTPRISNGAFSFVIPILLGWLYAASDEYHQAFVPGRGPAITDVCIDGSGVIFGVALAFFAILIYKKSKFAQPKG